jgi:hypothetical protein
MSASLEVAGWADPEFGESGSAREFPEEWGLPVGRRFSEERAQWVRQRVQWHSALTAHRRLADRDLRLLHVLRAAQLHQHGDGP